MSKGWLGTTKEHRIKHLELMAFLKLLSVKSANYDYFVHRIPGKKMHVLMPGCTKWHELL